MWAVGVGYVEMNDGRAMRLSLLEFFLGVLRGGRGWFFAGLIIADFLPT